MENTESDGTVTVEEAIRIPLNASKEEIEEALRQRYLVNPSDSVDVAIAKVKAGVTFLQGSGQSYSTDDLALNTGSSGLAAIDDMLQNALKNAEAGRSVRIFFRNVTVAGLVLDYAVDVTQEIDRYGNVGYRAQLVGGAHITFKAGAGIIVSLVAARMLAPGILISAAVAGVSAFAISVGYDFLVKDQIAERVRRLYDDSQHETPAPAEPSPVTEDAPMSGGTATEGFFDSVGSFLGGVGSGVADFFGGLFGGGASGGASFMPTSSAPFGKSSGVDPLVLYGLQRQQQPLYLEKVLSQTFDKHADSLIEKLLGKNSNLFQQTLGRTLATSFDLFASSIRNSKSKGLEDALLGVFSGKGGQDFTSNLAAATAGEFLNYGIQELFYKERTSVSSRESDRSRQALNDFRISRGQQAAELTRMVQRGQRNL